jgi:uncharacterized protein YkwD
MISTAPHHRPGRLVAALGLALTLLAGATAQRAAAAGRGKPLTVENGVVKPGQPPAASYGPDKAATCPSGGAYRIVQDELAEAAKSASKPIPETDGRLCAIADAFMGWNPAQGRPRPEVLAFISHHYGLVSPVAEVVTAQIDTDDQALIAERILKPLGNFAVNVGHARYGLVLQESRKGPRGSAGTTKIVLVLQDTGADVEPFPRRLAPGQAATLKGALLAPYQSPTLLVGGVSGELSRSEQGTGTAFTGWVKCGDRAGTVHVEIRGEREGRSAPVASFPVACGTELPTSVALAGPEWPQDVESQEKKLLELLNAERSNAGLKPLVWDDGVAGVARKLSQGFADEATKGSGGGQDVAKELKAIGVTSQLVVQSVVADRSVQGAHERLLRSPSNRANLLNPDTTNAGVGVASVTDSDGHPLVYLTEVFIKELPPIDAAKAREDLREAVMRKRKDARTTAVASDPSLEELAQKYATDLAAAGGQLSKEQAAPITAELNKGFKAVSIVKGAKAEPLDFAEEPEITGPGKLLGVGVAQGKNATLGRNATYAVIMIATPRGAAEAAGTTKASGAKPAGKPAKPKPTSP